MTPPDMESLIAVLIKVAKGLESVDVGRYTITGAADWPILVAMGGILVAIIGFMWADLRATIKDHRGEAQAALDRHCANNEKEIDLLWAENRAIRQEMKECKEKCCDG